MFIFLVYFLESNWAPHYHVSIKMFLTATVCAYTLNNARYENVIANTVANYITESIRQLFSTILRITENFCLDIFLVIKQRLTDISVQSCQEKINKSSKISSKIILKLRGVAIMMFSMNLNLYKLCKRDLIRRRISLYFSWSSFWKLSKSTQAIVLNVKLLLIK